MMTTTRRTFVKGAGLAASGVLVGGALGAQPAVAAEASRFRFCLNMSTIRGQNLAADEEMRIAHQAGYDAVEPWLGKLHEFAAQGGSLRDLRKQLDDWGLTVESAIGFAPWIVDDDTRRAAGFEQARRDMELIAQLGGKRIAAPPAGVGRGERVDPRKAAARYRQLLELGEEVGVTPQIEMWGGNSSIGRVSTAISIAIESGHPKACFLGDVYHTYKGGCDFNGLRLLGPQALQVFHMNDYPADPPRETIRDEHRVFPGDGIAPLSDILQIFREVRAYPVLSLELFNRQYWERPALEVARTGLEKMKQAVG
jgi:sugar phosphate isomerase/epimerase